MGQKIKCACCGYLTIEDVHNICPVCFWQKDPDQEKDIDEFDEEWGANQVSLRQAIANYKKFGVSDARTKRHVRPPNKDEL